MGGFAGAVIALDHDPPVEGKARQDGQRGFVVEAIGLIDLRNQFAGFAEGRADDVGIDAEDLAHGNRNIRQMGLGGVAVELGGGHGGNYPVIGA